MPRKPKLNDSRLQEVASFLARPGVDAEIHAEVPVRFQTGFEAEYQEASSGFPLPLRTDEEPYYIWGANTNKQGRQLRIYYTQHEPVPVLIGDLTTDCGKRGSPDRCRINHSNLVMQLVECGFILGSNTGNEERIEKFMANRFS